MTTDRINHPINNSKDPAIIDRPKRIRKGNLSENAIYRTELLYAKYDEAGALLSFIIEEGEFWILYDRPTTDWFTETTDRGEGFYVIPSSDLMISWERKR